MRYSRRFHVFRQREEGVWVYKGEQLIESNAPITTEGCYQLAVRAYMNESKNAGGVFAVVPVDEWRIADARRKEPEIVPSSAKMVSVE